MIRVVECVILVSLVLGVFAQNLPAVYNVTSLSSPEGIDYDSQNSRFVVGSLRTQIISAITLAGDASVLINDSRLASGSVGVTYFEGDLLIVATNTSALAAFGGSYTPGNVQSALVVANATTGVIKDYIDLTSYGDPNNMFGNDVAASTIPGVFYVTDSFGRQVWRVDTTNRIVQTIRDSLFSVNASFIGLNGISPIKDYHITCTTDTGILYKIRNDGTVSIVNNLTVPSCDGIRTTAKSPSTLIFSTSSTIYEVASDDDFTTAYIAQSQNTIYREVTTSALVPSNNQQLVYSLNGFSVPPYIERTLTINNIPCQSTPSPSPSPSCCGCSQGSNEDGSVIINFYFADILRGL